MDSESTASRCRRGHRRGLVCELRERGRLAGGRRQSAEPASLLRTGPHRSLADPSEPGELEESHGGGCSVEGESSRPIAFPQRTRGRAGEGWGTCERARV